VFVWVQFGFLVPAVVVLFLFPSSDWSVYVFLVLVVLSRVGLWGFDLVEVQLMQTTVLQSESGSINASEYSLYSLFSTLPLIAALVMREASLFVWLVVASAVFVLTAAALFFAYAAKIKTATTQHKMEVIADEDAWSMDEEL
jgi:iron-regulated transporter 1